MLSASVWGERARGGGGQRAADRLHLLGVRRDQLVAFELRLLHRLRRRLLRLQARLRQLRL